jgi:uncharacterized protein YndB with AHSA1/START domain
MTDHNTAAGPATRTITITRVFDAPRELVFSAWIDPAHIVHWFYASEGWTTPFAETDPRAGGAFRIGFASPDGKGDFTFEGAYDEVVAPERLVFTIGDGRPVVVTLAEHEGKTRLDLVLTLESTHSAEQQREGWTAMLVHLGEYLAKG